MRAHSGTHTAMGVQAGLTIVVEIQVYHSAILEIKKVSHKLYDVTRASGIEALR